MPRIGRTILKHRMPRVALAAVSEGPLGETETAASDRTRNQKVLKWFFLSCMIPYVIGCGSDTISPLLDSVPTDSPPTVTRINPTNGSAGAVIQIFGFGFSTSPEQNVILIGDQSTRATSYQLVTPPVTGEVESLTFAVPGGVQNGVNSITVVVDELISNTNMTLATP